MELSDEQSRALEAIDRWLDNPYEPFYLAGPAGTGKTTLAKHLHTVQSGDIVYGAYTGKAAHVLRRKGMPATTIHSAIYEPTSNYEARAELLERRDDLAAAEEMGDAHADLIAELEAEVAKLEHDIRRPAFRFNPDSAWADADLIVLDEVSMVNEAIADDILSFGVPVLLLGDPFQLPPVAGEGYFTKREPDFELKQVHRQALKSPVYTLATAVRYGAQWPVEKVSLEAAMAADQIICWKNETRWNLINRVREKLGRPAGVPVPGDRIMCLVNNRDMAVFNGAQFEVLDSHGSKGYGDNFSYYTIDVRDDEGLERELLAYREGFQGLAGETEGKNLRAWRGPVGLFTFAQVITAHKSQGSEWDSVYVVDQTHQMWKSSQEEKARWCYTAISRASKSVTVARTGVR